MTKKRKRIVSDPNQMSLLDLLTADRTERSETIPGRLCVNAKLQSAVKLAIKNAPKSRETLADDMSDLIGQTITVHQINNWTSDNHPHRIPAEFLPAFCQATGSTEPLRMLAEAAGLFALQAPDALRAEIQQYDEAVNEARAEKRKRMVLLAAIEGDEI